MRVTSWAVGLCFAVVLPSVANASEPIGHWTELPQRNRTTAEHQAVVLNDGRLMVLGGFDGLFWEGAAPTGNCETYDPRKPDRGWFPCAPIPEGKAMFWAATLPSGNVLVAGNFINSAGDPFTSYVYVPSQGRWVAVPAGPTGPTAQLVNPHSIMTPITLDDGSVLIAGGSAFDGSFASNQSFRFYENRSHPEKGRWVRSGDMTYAAVSAAYTKLSDGRVLFAGGLEDERFGSYITSSQATVYDPHTGQWTAVDDMPACVGTDAPPEWWATYGGPDCDPADASCVGNHTNPGSRWYPAVGALPGGDALVVGGSTWGADENDWWSYVRYSAVRFDGSTGTWSEVEPSTDWRYMARGISLPLGYVFVDGGYKTASAEIYSPWTDTWYDAGSYSDLPACDEVAPGEACFNFDENGGQLRQLKDGRIVRTCGYDWSEGWACDRAWVWSLSSH